MTTLKPVLIGTALFLVILVSGCVVQQVNETDVEKTALLSLPQLLCFELNDPPAIFDFAYQEDGEIKYVSALTTCADPATVNATTFLGEQITLHFKGQTPVRITRENGDTYAVEVRNASKRVIARYFKPPLNTAVSLKHFRSSNPEKFIAECLLINDSNQRDICLSYQAAFQQNITLCDKLVVSSSCKQWIQNIKYGNVYNSARGP